MVNHVVIVAGQFGVHDSSGANRSYFAVMREVENNFDPLVCQAYQSLQTP